MEAKERYENFNLDFYNALACKSLGRRFGHHRSFQLVAQETSLAEFKRITPQQRGYFAFDADSNYDKMHARLEQGWTVPSTKMKPQSGWNELKPAPMSEIRSSLIWRAVALGGE